MLDLIKNGISIVIPTFNEEKNVLNTLKNIEKHVGVEKEVIVVDDSTDSTGKIVKEYARSHPGIYYIKNRPQSKSFVRSISVGVKSAKKDVIVFMMADRCDDPQTVNKMYLKILDGWDVVCGSRYMKGGKRLGGPEIPGQMSKYLCYFCHLFTGIPTYDVTNSFKMYRKRILKKMKYNFRAETAVSMELLYQAYYEGAKITEVPTTWKGRSETRFKFGQRGPKYIKILVWSLENKLRKNLGLPLKRFYGKNK